MEKQFTGKWPDFDVNATTLLRVSRNLEKITDSVCTADICEPNCQADRESVHTIKKNTEELMENCLLSEKAAVTHTNKVQEKYDNLVEKTSRKINLKTRKMMTVMTKMSVSPLHVITPTTMACINRKYASTKKFQSRQYENPNGHKTSNNGYTTLYV